MPDLIIQILGYSTVMFNPKIEEEIVQAIVDVAEASSMYINSFSLTLTSTCSISFIDAWIITTGYKDDRGSQLVGEAIYKSRMKGTGQKFNAIAVGNWRHICMCEESK